MKVEHEYRARAMRAVVPAAADLVRDQRGHRLGEISVHHDGVGFVGPRRRSARRPLGVRGR